MTKKQVQCVVIGLGERKDAANRTHSFSVERLDEIAKNTNESISMGQRVPLLTNSYADAESVVGHLENFVCEKDSDSNEYSLTAIAYVDADLNTDRYPQPVPLAPSLYLVTDTVQSACITPVSRSGGFIKSDRP